MLRKETIKDTTQMIQRIGVLEEKCETELWDDAEAEEREKKRVLGVMQWYVDSSR